MSVIKSKKTWFIALFTSSVLAILISNVEVLAQPYKRSPALHPKIEFKLTEFRVALAREEKSTQDKVVEPYKIHYAAAGDKTKPGIIFVHGTPGGWGAFERYLENPRMRDDFYMVAVDRMGWGLSALPKRQVNGDFMLQAQSISAIMRQYPDKKWTIVGHSLGASIAPKIALLAPESVDSLLLLAGSLNPRLGKPRWYNWAASTWIVSRLIGESMRYSNREIMALRSELKKMDLELKQSKLDIHVAVMQGAKDKLVSPRNPAYVSAEWQSVFADVELIELANEGHFLPWRQTSLVVETIYSLRAARATLGR